MFIRKSLYDMGSYWADRNQLSRREMRLVLRSARSRGRMVPKRLFMPSLVIAATVAVLTLLGIVYTAHALIELPASPGWVFATVFIVVCALAWGPATAYLLIQWRETWRLWQLEKLLKDPRFVSVRHPALAALLRASGDDHDLFDRYPGVVNALLADTGLCGALERANPKAYEWVEGYVDRLHQFDKSEARRNSQAIQANGR